MNTINAAVSWAVGTANDNSHGYDQGNRWGPDYDCSSLVITAFKKAGIPLNCTYTGNMLTDMLANGFKNVTDSVNLATGVGLQKGDVLLNIVNHTALYIGNGQLVQASGNEHGSILGGKSGDQTGYEISVRSYYNFPWDRILRYEEPIDAVTKPQSKPEVLSEKIQNGTYTVKSGDTLSGIALKFYGNANLYTKIMRDNNLTSDLIYIDQVLKINPLDSVPSVTPTMGPVEPAEMCSVSLPVLKYGDIGMAVRKVQALLKTMGYDISIDGDFGSETLATLKNFQVAKGVPVDGVVGAKTYEALLS